MDFTLQNFKVIKERKVENESRLKETNDTRQLSATCDFTLNPLMKVLKKKLQRTLLNKLKKIEYE